MSTSLRPASPRDDTFVLPVPPLKDIGIKVAALTVAVSAVYNTIQLSSLSPNSGLSDMAHVIATDCLPVNAAIAGVVGLVMLVAYRYV